MEALITGTSSGIGRAVAEKFLLCHIFVRGLDIETASIQDSLYQHYQADVRGELPDIPPVKFLVNCAGIQKGDETDIDTNLKGLIKVTEKYGVHPGIVSIVNIASASAHNGAEFPEYAASKGGVLAYTKNVAQRVAAYKAVCNSVSPGGVYTESNAHILNDPKLLEAVHNETLLGKWAKPEEVADLVYYLAVINQSITGQDVIIDNGELAKFNFIW